MEKIIIIMVNFLVFISRFVRLGGKWKKGKTLKILLVGYNGARNTGADARVSEMVRQFQELLKDRSHQITVISLKPKNIALYFNSDVVIKKVGITFLKDIFIETHRSHMVVLCEGSTLKSQFSDMLTLAFGLSAGIMKSLKRPSIAYGSEAGHMSDQIYNVSKRLFSETYFIARTEDSLKIIHEMGLEGHLGTDTAWTLIPLDSYQSQVHQELVGQGWNQNKKLIGVCAINPFWWPVKPDLWRFVKTFYKKDPLRYKFWMYHQFNPNDSKMMDQYLLGMATAINEYCHDKDGFVVLIGMEALDVNAITSLRKMLTVDSALFNASEYDAYFLTTLLLKIDLLVTSRYHARVLSLSGGTPAIAVSMDERLLNIFKELGMEQYYLKTDDRQLGSNLKSKLYDLDKNRDVVIERLKEKYPVYLKRFKEMGDYFKDYIESSFN